VLGTTGSSVVVVGVVVIGVIVLLLVIKDVKEEETPGVDPI